LALTRAAVLNDDPAQAATGLAVAAAGVPVAPAFPPSDPVFGGLPVEPLGAGAESLEAPDEELTPAPPSAPFFPDDPPEL